MYHFAHLFSFDDMGAKEECQEKIICLKPSSINAFRIFPRTFFLTFFSFLYPTVLFMLYTHAYKKNVSEGCFYLPLKGNALQSCLENHFHDATLPNWKPFLISSNRLITEPDFFGKFPA